MADTPKSQRCGFVAIVGRPNVGKSTLMNHLLGQKLSITSRKPQTTRHNLLGVDTVDEHQAIYVDTPGIHDAAQGALNRYMVRNATSVLRDVDLIVFVVDRGTFNAEDELVLRHVERAGVPALAVINKVDLLSSKDLTLPIIDQLQRRAEWAGVFAISALKDGGLEPLREAIFATLPEAAHVYPPDQLTDRNERFMCTEIIREKLMRRLGDELPHRLTVAIESYHDRPHLVSIHAVIVVERDGQKRILIGRDGERIKGIGTQARQDIERLLGRKVMLKLWVKVKSGWTNDERHLKRYGYE